jgi:hypothetical protein
MISIVCSFTETLQVSKQVAGWCRAPSETDSCSRYGVGSDSVVRQTPTWSTWM